LTLSTLKLVPMYIMIPIINCRNWLC
jgi:hypothetical protein